MTPFSVIPNLFSFQLFFSFLVVLVFQFLWMIVGWFSSPDSFQTTMNLFIWCRYFQLVFHITNVSTYSLLDGGDVARQKLPN